MRPGPFIVFALTLPLVGWAAARSQTDALMQQAQTLVGDASRFWTRELSLSNPFAGPGLRFFSHQIKGVCNAQQTLSGPFYCPADLTLYVDQAFLQQLVERAGNARGLALAYLIGHEVGHYVQNVLGTTAAVEQSRSRSAPDISARTWVADELQADCYAGMWMGSAAKNGAIKLSADVSPALEAVAAVSHEWSAHLAAGQAMVDPFSYGTAAERVKWLRRGLDSGRLSGCDTFAAEAAGGL